MPTTDTETPDNFGEIVSFAEIKTDRIKDIFYSAGQIAFYDACSLQRHAGFATNERKLLIRYYKTHETVIFITRCILMELSGERHRLAEACVHFIREMSESDISVVVFPEEATYDILAECFAANERVNEYLKWAVGNVNAPISTIGDTLKADKKLTAEVIGGKQTGKSDVYRRFFTAVRGNKAHADNLGEELIAVCVHILSRLPGLADGKLCVVTDDKGAAAKIDSALKRTNVQYRGAKVMLFSTPKLVQYMYREHSDISENELTAMLSQGASGHVAVMGTTPYDLRVNEKISMTSEELAREIMEPNGIHIVF